MGERYEEVRRKLVERGYLQGPIERFLLRDLLAGKGTLVRASLKAATLGAPLMGGLLAASTVAANRPAFGSQDALVLWLYFAVLSGAVLFTLDLSASAAASAWARRRGARRSDAVRAGLIVAVPLLVYLVILWARGRPDGGAVGDVLFLAAAAGVATLVAWLAGLVSLAGIVGRTGEVPDRGRRSVVVVLAVLIPIAAVFFVLKETVAAHGAHAIPPSSFAARPTRERLLVVGVDGLDAALVETGAGQGTTERLMALFARGALYPKHRAPAEPPEVWTTIATGMSADAHGVRSAGVMRLPGIASPIAPRSGPVLLDAALDFAIPARTLPTSGAGRRVRALWEIAGLAHPAAAVGWWASWPARGTEGDADAGYVVSDRVLAKLLSSRTEDRDTSPASLYARLAGTFPADRDAWRRDFEGRFAPLSPELHALAWESYLIDEFAWRTTLALLADPAIATAFAYLPGLDILRARLESHPDGAAAVELYVRWLDESVFGELASRHQERIVIVGDPGRGAGRDAEGFVAVVGGGAAPRCVGPPIGDLDVAPLILRLADLPASREMPGHAPARCFEGGDPAPSPIASWGRRGRPRGDARSDYDPEMLDRLRSLGYVR